MTGTTETVLPGADPEAWIGEMWALTPGGGHVAYGAGDRPSPTLRLYVRSMATGADELVSGAADGPKDAASLSADGSLVAYQTRSAGDDPADVLVRNRATGETVHVDKGLGKGELVQLSEDGRYVLFDAGGGAYLRDLRSDTTRRVADRPAVSASRDVRYAVLAGEGDLALLDLRTGGHRPVGPGGAVPGAVTARGRGVVFTSEAADLVPDDTNGDCDLFLRHTR
ncbi:TolB family protein [Streptomyces sp. NPDC003032]